MRKQTKIAAVVSAAALLALGASITSFAAAKGTWMMVDGEWYCYDKNGEAYENKFCSSNGKEYYVGEDGQLVRSSWVDGTNGEYYFVNSSGAKITNDWRLTTPYDDDSADEEWYYFKADGKMATNTKIAYKGKTYFFDAAGKMLTGWVTADGTQVANEENSINKDYTYYCGEDGARLEKAWIYTTEPTTEDAEADADENWYYLKSNGNPVVNKKQNNPKGQSYIFDEQGVMLYGWVAKLATNSDAAYEKIDKEGTKNELGSSEYEKIYFCGGEDDGHVKKNKWIKTWRPENTYDEDEDEDMYWYWIKNNGEVYVPSDSDATAQKYKLGDGSMDKKGDEIGIAKYGVGSKDYFFNMNGEMMSQFMDVIRLNTNKIKQTGVYYLGGDNDGSMKTGTQTITDENGDSYKFCFGTKEDEKGRGFTGNKSNKLYYKGLLLKAEDDKYAVATVDGHDFIVNANGSIQYSNIKYTEDKETLIDASDSKKVVFNKASNDQWKYSVTGLDTDNVPTININKVMDVK